MKAEKFYWVIVGPTGIPAINHISFKKKDAINSFIESTAFDWQECLHHGWRCIKIQLLEVKP